MTMKARVVPLGYSSALGVASVMHSLSSFLPLPLLLFGGTRTVTLSPAGLCSAFLHFPNAMAEPGRSNKLALRIVPHSQSPTMERSWFRRIKACKQNIYLLLVPVSTSGVLKTMQERKALGTSRFKDWQRSTGISAAFRNVYIHQATRTIPFGLTGCTHAINAQAACSHCKLTLDAYAACLCCRLMLQAYTADSRYMLTLHAHAARLRCTFTLHAYPRFGTHSSTLIIP